MDKELLRREFLKKREAISPLEFTLANQKIWARLKALIPWKKLSSIHLYLTIPGSREIHTQPVIDHLRNHYPHIDLVVPKVISNFQLEHYLLQEDTVLVHNAWGIPEPETGLIYPLSKLDLVLVPMLIFDRSGHRLGYGKGFYDRFLANCPQSTSIMGLSLFDPIKAIPHEPTDIPLKAAVTPEKVFNFN